MDETNEYSFEDTLLMRIGELRDAANELAIMRASVNATKEPNAAAAAHADLGFAWTIFERARKSLDALYYTEIRSISQFAHFATITISVTPPKGEGDGALQQPAL